MKKPKIAIVYGTRPDAIKMAPLIHCAREESDLEALIVSTGQHRELTKQVEDAFRFTPDYQFSVMYPGQNLQTLTRLLCEKMDDFLVTQRPDAVVVHGDTTTAFACALSSFYARIPVAHVEAGLRTGDLNAPFPEEMNRVFIDRIARWCFSPSAVATRNLRRELVPEENIFECGNTVVDALEWMRDFNTMSGFIPTVSPNAQGRSPANPVEKIVWITCHRRENFGEPIRRITQAIRSLAKQHSEILFCISVHPNPNVEGVVRSTLDDVPNVWMSASLDYRSMCFFLNKAEFVLTDSGGIQEECAALGKPLIVLRNETERPEIVLHGLGVLCGSDPQAISNTFSMFLQSERKGKKLKVYGDRFTSNRIIETLMRSLHPRKEVVQAMDTQREIVLVNSVL